MSLSKAILALDCSTEFVDCSLLTPSLSVSTIREYGPASSGLAQAVERLLSEAQISFEQLDQILVGVGPGSFTGLRVALAYGQGLVAACQSELCGFSSYLAAAASDLCDNHSSTVGTSPRILVVLGRARREHLYIAGYLVEEVNSGPEISRLFVEEVIHIEQVAERLDSLLEQYGAKVSCEERRLIPISGEVFSECEHSGRGPLLSQDLLSEWTVTAPKSISRGLVYLTQIGSQDAVSPKNGAMEPLYVSEVLAKQRSWQ